MTQKLIELIKENPDLPVIPMVDYEVVGDDSSTYWMGQWGRCEVTEYYNGWERIHFRDDDEENIINDLAEGMGWGCDREGRDIYDLTDEEWNELVKSIPWTKAIVVYITT